MQPLAEQWHVAKIAEMNVVLSRQLVHSCLPAPMANQECEAEAK